MARGLFLRSYVMDTLRTGVDGLNAIGGRHEKTIAEMNRAELVAVADLREDLRGDFAEA